MLGPAIDQAGLELTTFPLLLFSAKTTDVCHYAGPALFLGPFRLLSQMLCSLEALSSILKAHWLCFVSLVPCLYTVPGVVNFKSWLCTDLSFLPRVKRPDPCLTHFWLSQRANAVY